MIPVATPDIGELEQKYVMEAVNSGWVSSLGEFIGRFEKSFADFCEVEHGVAVSNGTDALLVALRALDIGPGDEVIVPALTFAAVPAAVRHAGAEVVVADVHPDYWCLDPVSVAQVVSPLTRAILVVHSYGHPADMDPLLQIAKDVGAVVIEDCAEAHGARYKGRLVGSLGAIGCFSFYGNKIVTTGEGGMVVTDDDQLANRVRYLKDHAMDPKRRYYHTEVGYNQRMTNLQAAVGCAQMERIDELLGKRTRLLQWYRECLDGTPYIATVNPKMSWAEPVNWMVSVLLDDDLAFKRDELMEDLLKRGIDTRPFFIPVNQLPPYSTALGISSGNNESISDRVGRAGLNLPSSTTLTKDHVLFVAKGLRDSVESVINK